MFLRGDHNCLLIFVDSAQQDVVGNEIDLAEAWTAGDNLLGFRIVDARKRLQLFLVGAINVTGESRVKKNRPGRVAASGSFSAAALAWARLTGLRLL